MKNTKDRYSSTALTRNDEGYGDSIRWAIETHLKQQDDCKFHYAVLFGNEDCPAMIQFWKDSNPLVEDSPDYTWKG